MSLYRFQIFATAAKYLNLSQASKELHVSQPAISQQLKLLQDEFNIKLFEKRGRGIALTAQGQTFRRDIDPILVENEKLKKKYNSAGSDPKREFVSLGGSTRPSTSLLPSLMSEFCSRYPSTRLHFLAGTSDEIEAAVANGQIDVGIVTEPFPSPLLIMEPYRTEKFVAFISSRHPLARRPKVTIAELGDFRLVINAGKDGNGRMGELLSRVTNDRIRLNGLITCESTDAVKSVVRKSAGVGFVYQDVIMEDVQAGKFRIVKLPSDLCVQDYIIYSRQKPLSSAATEFLKLLQASRPKSPWKNIAKASTARKWATSARAFLILKALGFLAELDCDFVGGFLT
jgi:DNA-binding transcriptional LysR family regulator